MDGIKRTLKTMPNFKTNSPDDFFHFDYSLGYYLPETKARIDEAVNGVYAQIAKILDDDRAGVDEGKVCNWLSINLPENCPNICISFKRELAEMQIEKFGARPLYGFDSKKEGWLPVEIFITYGGTLAPGQRCPEEKLSRLKGILDANPARVPGHELETKYRLAYEKIQNEIRELEKSIGKA